MLFRGLKPLDLQQLRFAKGDLYFVLVNPKFEAPTAEMRAVLPKMVPMVAAINNSAMGGSLVSIADLGLTNLLHSVAVVFYTEETVPHFNNM